MGLAALALSGCSITDINNPVLRAGWPEGITPQATRMQHLWTWSIVAAMLVGIIVWGLVFWTMLFHRKRKSSPEFPRQTQYNVPLELVYTAIPFVGIAVLFFFTVQTQNFVDKDHDPDTVGVHVDVTAKKWNWTFGYRNVNNHVLVESAADGAVVNGDADSVKAQLDGFDYTTPYVDWDFDPFTWGVDVPADEAEAYEDARGNPRLPENETAKAELQQEVERGRTKAGENLSYLWSDDIETVGTTEEIPVLVLPANTPVSFTLASVDVIHAFWVPQFLFKRDVFPDPVRNQSKNTFTIDEIYEPGAFVGRCAELCGTYHAMMNFEVRALPIDMYIDYMKLRDPEADDAQELSHSAAMEALAEDSKYAEYCEANEDVCAPLAVKTEPFEARYLQQADSADLVTASQN